MFQINTFLHIHTNTHTHTQKNLKTVNQRQFSAYLNNLLTVLIGVIQVKELNLIALILMLV